MNVSHQRKLTNIPGIQHTLRSRVKAYLKRASEMEAELKINPNDWGKFQSEFNQEINGIFRDLMNFEKENINNGNENKVYRLKKFFIKWFRSNFIRGEYLKRSLEKPRGYAGDYKIIDMIYQNDPSTAGFDRLFDNYFQMSSICNAVRNRKEDFKRIVAKYINENNENVSYVMDLASGPARDVFELLNLDFIKSKSSLFHCYENDEEAILYANNILNNDKRVKFIKANAVRIALKKDIHSLHPPGYDVIFSTGLFDYLDFRVSVRLVRGLRNLLRSGGVLAISDVYDKFSNPSIYFMEWVSDWSLIYRSDSEFEKIFLEAGFKKEELIKQFEQQGVMQYIIARKP
jgi:extracellular factor (EF) 3-hydroxypalmitic acid methyl ester biosynthesis protein